VLARDRFPRSKSRVRANHSLWCFESARHPRRALFPRHHARSHDIPGETKSCVCSRFVDNCRLRSTIFRRKFTLWSQEAGSDHCGECGFPAHRVGGRISPQAAANFIPVPVVHDCLVGSASAASLVRDVRSLTQSDHAPNQLAYPQLPLRHLTPPQDDLTHLAVPAYGRGRRACCDSMALSGSAGRHRRPGGRARWIPIRSIGTEGETAPETLRSQGPRGASDALESSLGRPARGSPKE
jgi:hypothetical protein